MNEVIANLAFGIVGGLLIFGCLIVFNLILELNQKRRARKRMTLYGAHMGSRPKYNRELLAGREDHTDYSEPLERRSHGRNQDRLDREGS